MITSTEFDDYLEMVINKKGWRMPKTLAEARTLYNNLVAIALNGV